MSDPYGEKKNHAGLGGGRVSFALCNKDVQAPSKYSLLIILRLRDLFDCLDLSQL